MVVALAGVLFGVCAAARADAPAPVVDPEAYTFVVAGHTYGAHTGDNVGLLPRFRTALEAQPEMGFLVLTGDFVREATEDHYSAVLGELAEIGRPFYLVLGNHDEGPGGRTLLEERYGGTSYAFTVDRDLFLVLDSQPGPCSFDDAQMALVETRLAQGPWRNVFVFFHEVLWLGAEAYDGLQANFGDDPAYRETSFWAEVYPRLERHPDTPVYVLAGDVGGRPGAMPAFFDRVGNVSLVASGMGEVEDENFLRVDVAGGKVSMTVMPLQAGKPIRPVEWFNPYNLRHRLVAQCVHPGCVLPQTHAEPGLWDRLLSALGIR